MIKKILGLATLLVFSYSVVAESIPVPMCSNGKWVVDPPWRIVTLDDCTNQKGPQKINQAIYNQRKEQIVARFENPTVIIDSYGYTPIKGDKNWQVMSSGVLVCHENCLVRKK